MTENVESKPQDEQISNGCLVCGCYRKLGCKFGCKFAVTETAARVAHSPCARSRKEWYWRQCVMAAALSFALASLAESATAAPQLASPALAVKAGRQRGLTCGVVGQTRRLLLDAA